MRHMLDNAEEAVAMLGDKQRKDLKHDEFADLKAGQARILDGLRDLLARDNRPSPASEPVKVRAQERCLSLLATHPEWTNKRIAEAAGIHRTTINRRNMPLFMAARAQLKQGKVERPRGFRDPETGELEAWRPEDEEFFR